MSKNKYSTLTTPNVVSAVFNDGTTKAVFASSPRYGKVLEAIKSGADEEELKNLMDGRKFIRAWSCGEFLIDNNRVYWVKKPTYQIPQPLVDRLMEYADNGFPAEAFTKFLSRLLENPSKRSVETFYGFIEQQGLVIDDEGYVIGYKGVSNDLKDCYTGTFDNSPGSYHEMPRNHVNDDPNMACSEGFHFGGHEYASTFGSRMVLVKVDPKDLVCVPHDCSQGKVRVCRYWVLKEVPNERQMKAYYGAGLQGDDPEEEFELSSDGPECPACGTIFELGDAYCRGCGLKLPEPEEEETFDSCPNCGRERDESCPGSEEYAQFCAGCGYEFND